MKEINPLERIRGLCTERGWTYYQLSKASGIPYSTLNTMLHKDNMPSLPTLQKLCRGFGISLSEFFEAGRSQRGLTEDQSRCLALCTSLSPEDRKLALAFMKGLAKKLN
ncbi:MAG TPA: helix-turn-helix domain-containing protein [Candidatus Lachnoclostridium avicola]|nr:helix-turn-helix domain-containing protein [Candidatus Lachnoclostridium avicola]